MSSLDNDFWVLLKNLYLPSSHISLVAGSRQILTSLPGEYPALLMASNIISTACSLEFKSGAKPPSSPTPVLRPLDFKIPFKVWNTSVPIRIDSLNDVALWGVIINS